MTPSLWTGMYAEKPLEEALRLMAEGGWNVFEISTEHLDQLMTSETRRQDIDLCLQAMAELNLVLPQAHGYLAADVAHPDSETQELEMDHIHRHIELSAAFGVEVMVLHPGGRNIDTGNVPEIFQANIEPLRTLGAAALSHGMKIAIENMSWFPFTTPSDMKEFIQAVDHPSVGLALDTSHANMMAIDSGEFAREIGPWLVATHISDNDGSGDQHKIPGNGTVDWSNLMAGLRSASFTNPLNFEIPGERLSSLPLRRAKVRHARDVADVLLEEL